MKSLQTILLSQLEMVKKKLGDKVPVSATVTGPFTIAAMMETLRIQRKLWAMTTAIQPVPSAASPDTLAEANHKPVLPSV